LTATEVDSVFLLHFIFCTVFYLS